VYLFHIDVLVGDDANEAFFLLVADFSGGNFCLKIEVILCGKTYFASTFRELGDLFSL